MSVDSSPTSSNPDDSAVDLVSSVSSEKCVVCGRTAFCYNYGVLTCNACKMFFRRVKVDKITYTCKFWNNCYDGIVESEFTENFTAPRCRACRFQRCVTAGMKYTPPGKLVLELKNQKDDFLGRTIRHLVFLDSRRQYKAVNLYTSEDLTIQEMLERGKGSRMVQKTNEHSVTIHEWSFFGIYASVEFFLSLDWMDSLTTSDKVALLRSFSMKSMLLSCAVRTKNERRDTIVTPDGHDVYPDSLYRLSLFSLDFLHRIRSLLPSRLIELNITNEEHVLLTVILFSNPGLSLLSDDARNIVSSQQKAYSSVLFQHCLLTHQKSGPSRFADLLSLCHVINKNFEDVFVLTTLFHIKMPSICFKRLFVECLSNVE